MSAKDAILGKIHNALDRDSASERVLTLADRPAEITERLKGQRRHTLPKVDGDLLETLTTAMEGVLMSVVRLQSADNCPGAVAGYLEAEGIDHSQAGAVTVAPALAALNWPGHYATGAATGVEQVSITPCLAAVAETGSIVTASSADTPTTLNFLPETHIIIVRESQVVRHVDDVFALFRARDELPRAVNFITGPSRTADIEQTIEIGAHGPRRMHVLLIPDG